MVVAGFLSMVAPQPRLFSDGWIIGRDHPPFTSRHVLGRIERETPRPKTPHGPAVYRSCMRLGCVFDKQERVRLRKLSQAMHITRVTIQMYRYDCSRAASKSPLYLDGIKRVRVWLDIHKHRRGSNEQ